MWPATGAVPSIQCRRREPTSYTQCRSQFSHNSRVNSRIVTELWLNSAPATIFLSFFFLFSFPGNAVLQLHTNVFTSLLYCCYSYCVSFCALLDGVCLSKNKRITYLLTYLLNRWLAVSPTSPRLRSVCCCCCWRWCVCDIDTYTESDAQLLTEQRT